MRRTWCCLLRSLRDYKCIGFHNRLEAEIAEKRLQLGPGYYANAASNYAGRSARHGRVSRDSEEELSGCAERLPGSQVWHPPGVAKTAIDPQLAEPFRRAVSARCSGLGSEYGRGVIVSLIGRIS